MFLFFGILGGLQAYGFIGMFLGPAVIAMLVAFARIFREQYALDRVRGAAPLVDGRHSPAGQSATRGCRHALE